MTYPYNENPSEPKPLDHKTINRELWNIAESYGHTPNNFPNALPSETFQQSLARTLQFWWNRISEANAILESKFLMTTVASDMRALEAEQKKNFTACLEYFNGLSNTLRRDFRVVQTYVAEAALSPEDEYLYNEVVVTVDLMFNLIEESKDRHLMKMNESFLEAKSEVSRNAKSRTVVEKKASAEKQFYESMIAKMNAIQEIENAKRKSEAEISSIRKMHKEIATLKEEEMSANSSLHSGIAAFLKLEQKKVNGFKDSLTERQAQLKMSGNRITDSSVDLLDMEKAALHFTQNMNNFQNELAKTPGLKKPNKKGSEVAIVDKMLASQKSKSLEISSDWIGVSASIDYLNAHASTGIERIRGLNSVIDKLSSQEFNEITVVERATECRTLEQYLDKFITEFIPFHDAISTLKEDQKVLRRLLKKWESRTEKAHNAVIAAKAQGYPRKAQEYRELREMATKSAAQMKAELSDVEKNVASLESLIHDSNMAKTKLLSIIVSCNQVTRGANVSRKDFDQASKLLGEAFSNINEYKGLSVEATKRKAISA